MSRCWTATWNPAEVSVAVAVSWSRSMTSGTAVVVGPLETLSVTVEPWGATLFAEGISAPGRFPPARSMRSPGARTAKPSRLQLGERVRVRLADHVGDADLLRAARDVDAHDCVHVHRRVRARAPVRPPSPRLVVRDLCTSACRFLGWSKPSASTATCRRHRARSPAAALRDDDRDLVPLRYLLARTGVLLNHLALGDVGRSGRSTILWPRPALSSFWIARASTIPSTSGTRTSSARGQLHRGAHQEPDERRYRRRAPAPRVAMASSAASSPAAGSRIRWAAVRAGRDDGGVANGGVVDPRTGEHGGGRVGGLVADTEALCDARELGVHLLGAL